MFSSTKVKIFLALIVGILLGGAIWPAYNLGSEMYAEYQFGKFYQEEMVYRVIEAIEANGQDLFVLDIQEEQGYVTAFLYLDFTATPVFETDAETNAYFMGRVADVAVILQDFYRDSDMVSIVLSFIDTAAGFGGETVYYGVGGYLYQFTGAGVAALRQADCDTCVLALFDSLYEAGHFRYQNLLFYGGFPVTNLIDRGPGYVYPWE